MKRRDFFRITLPSVALPVLVNGFSLQAFAESPLADLVDAGEENDRVLVLVQLNGGNDGLNTIIPLDIYDRYYAARTNIAIPRDKVLTLEGADHTGLNPAMTHIQQLYNEGKVSIVQAVSYPKPNFSHFRATDIWLTGADSDQILESGWAGRYLDEAFPGFPTDYPSSKMTDPLAIQIGGIVSPALQGPLTTMGMAISNPTSFYDLLKSETATAPPTRAGDQLAYIRQMSVKTDQYAGVIKQAALKVKQQSDKYPPAGKNPLADQLKIVARLIAGGLKTKVYMVSMGGFDTHSRQTEQGNTTAGNHARLLGRLSEAVGAFMADINSLGAGDRVLGMTFSEFGRRIKSNASGGTDHGAGAPVILFGNKVKPGIMGTSPDIPAQATVKDNISMQHDFRALYAGILRNWFQKEPAETRLVLYKDFQPLSIV